MVEEHQDIEGVVDVLRRPASCIRCTTRGSSVPIKSRGAPGENTRVEIRLRVTADGGVARIQGNVLEVVKPREQAHLRELADTSEEAEPDVGIAVLDDRV